MFELISGLRLLLIIACLNHIRTWMSTLNWLFALILLQLLLFVSILHCLFESRRQLQYILLFSKILLLYRGISKSTLMIQLLYIRVILVSLLFLNVRLIVAWRSWVWKVRLQLIGIFGERPQHSIFMLGFPWGSWSNFQREEYSFVLMKVSLKLLIHCFSKLAMH